MTKHNPPKFGVVIQHHGIPVNIPHGVGIPGALGSGPVGDYAGNGVKHIPYPTPAAPHAVRPVVPKKKSPPKKVTTPTVKATPPRKTTPSVRVTPTVGGSPKVTTTGGSKVTSTASSTTTTPAAKTPTPPDAVSQMIAGSLQQAQRLTDYYDKQTLANQAATVAGGNVLAQAAGSLGSTVPTIGYASSGDALTNQGINSYADLLNSVGQTNAKTGAQVNQAHIGDSASALNAYYGQARAAQDMANAQYGTQLKASEPTLRAKYASDQADLAMKRAEQQYLQDKLSLSGKTAQANLQLGYDKLNSSNTNAANSNATKLTIARQKAIDAQMAAATKGQTMSAAQRKITQAWVDKHLFVKDPTTGALNQNTDVAFTDILDQLGALSGPAAAAQAAIVYSPKSIKQAGINDFYSALTGHGLSKRQAIKYLSAAGFPAKQVNMVKKYGIYASNAYGMGSVIKAGAAIAKGAGK